MRAAATGEDFSAVRVWADLARAGNFPSIASNVLAALVLSSASGPHWPEAGPLALAVLAGCLIYAGGATLNDVADAGFDATHRRERPIPRGAIGRAAAGILGGVQLVAGAILLLGMGAGPLPVLLLVGVIIAYDWLHKRWTGSVWLMGGCRMMLAAAVASLPGHAMAAPAFLAWIAALFLYVAGLSMLARREYRPGAPAERIGRQVGQLLALIPLLDALALLAVGAWAPMAASAAAYPLGRLAQRLAAST